MSGFTVIDTEAMQKITNSQVCGMPQLIGLSEPKPSPNNTLVGPYHISEEVNFLLARNPSSEPISTIRRSRDHSIKLTQTYPEQTAISSISPVALRTNQPAPSTRINNLPNLPPKPSHYRKSQILRPHLFPSRSIFQKSNP